MPHAPMPSWMLPEALTYIRDLQPRAMAVGWCVLLGGGVLNHGESAHDLDVLFYPRRIGVRRQDLLEILPPGRWDRVSVGDLYVYNVDGRRIEGIFQMHVPA